LYQRTDLKARLLGGLLVWALELQLKLWVILIRHWGIWRSPVLQARWVAQRVVRLVVFAEQSMVLEREL
jgi:hypothetical protein